MLDREHRRFYFQPLAEGENREVRYRPLNQRTSSRKVVWRRESKRTGELSGYWYHRAVALKFLKAGAESWCLSMRPERRVTVDGFDAPPHERIGGQVTRQKAQRFNYDLLGELNFWRGFLSGGSPRIFMRFGAEQVVVISTQLMPAPVRWPGIPQKHAMPFRNVVYLDNLFSWAEAAEYDSLGEGDDYSMAFKEELETSDHDDQV